jgi:endonuclease III
MLTELLETLEQFYGTQEAHWPVDPYHFLVWWHCGYPASDAACTRGWVSLTQTVGTDPEQFLQTSREKLAEALKPGGMVPELRALRLLQIAERVQKEFGGDLNASLRALPETAARAALKKFPNIAGPGADRILLFARLFPVAAVPSNCPHVLVRIERGREHESYDRTYREAQESISARVESSFEARIRAFLLLKQHGQTICKRTSPKCAACPVTQRCAFAAGKMRGRA